MDMLQFIFIFFVIIFGFLLLFLWMKSIHDNLNDIYKRIEIIEDMMVSDITEDINELRKKINLLESITRFKVN